MSSSDASGGSGGRRWFWMLFGLILLGGMGVLVAVLSKECSAGQDALGAYVGRVKGGEDVSTAIGGTEAARLTELLRSSTGVHVDNFQGQAGTACFWTTVTHAGGEADVQFLLSEGDEGHAVRQISAVRECECPDPDFERACHLVGAP